MTCYEAIGQFAVIATILCALGCGKAHPPVAEVRGNVSFKGKPVAGGRVMFLPDGGGKQGFGTIQPDGSYRLGTFGTDDGALVGKHHIMAVRVALTNRSTELESFSKAVGKEILVQPDKANVVDIDLSADEWEKLGD